jgi:hypothetical protein
MHESHGNVVDTDEVHSPPQNMGFLAMEMPW